MQSRSCGTHRHRAWTNAVKFCDIALLPAPACATVHLCTAGGGNASFVGDFQTLIGSRGGSERTATQSAPSHLATAARMAYAGKIVEEMQ